MSADSRCPHHPPVAALRGLVFDGVRTSTNKPTGGPMTKSGRQIMEILEAFDLTRCAHCGSPADRRRPEDRGPLRGHPRRRREPVRAGRRDPGSSTRSREDRGAGGAFHGQGPRRCGPRQHARADGLRRRRAHHPPGGGRGQGGVSTPGIAALYRPWVPEPGMWAQFDWGDGPVVGGRCRRGCSAPGWPGAGSGW